MTSLRLDLGALEALDGRTLVDLRTREEYDRGHVPGAISVPILDHDERARIGCTYHSRGEEAAKLEALSIVAPRLPSLVGRLAALTRAGPVVVYCWRGGARSTILGQLMASLGYPVHVLQGGYRAHRRAVMACLERGLPSFVVLHGYTGSGKTRLLGQLASRYPVIDLENLASHRGSTFGGLGLPPQPAQCQFESELVARLEALGQGPVLVEAESPAIGAIRLPQPLCRALRQGLRIFIDVPLQVRVANLVEDYGELVRTSGEGVETAFAYLATRLPRARIESWRALVAHHELERFAEELLVHHYDPLYERWRAKATGTFAATLVAESMAEALDRLDAHLTSLGLWNAPSGVSREMNAGRC